MRASTGACDGLVVTGQQTHETQALAVSVGAVPLTVHAWASEGPADTARKPDDFHGCQSPIHNRDFCVTSTTVT